VEKDFAEQMPNADILRALRRAHDEIMTLRRRNEVLSAQVHVLNIFEIALRPQSNFEGLVATEDVAGLLQRQINKLDPPLKK